MGAILDKGDTDLATLVTPASQMGLTSQVVKAVVSWQMKPLGSNLFSRAAVPTGTNALWHHIGYGWRRDAALVGQPPSTLELASLSSYVHLNWECDHRWQNRHRTRGIDTAEDLEAARLGAAAASGKIDSTTRPP